MSSTLGDNVLQSGLGVASQAGAGISDGADGALNAYKLMQDTKTQREDLDIRKKAADVTRAQMSIDTLANINKLPPKLQQQAVEGLNASGTAKSLGWSDDFGKALGDPDVRAKAGAHAAKLQAQGNLGDEYYKEVNTMTGGDVFATQSILQKSHEEQNKLRAASLGQDRLDSRERNQAQIKADKDPLLVQYTQRMDGAMTARNMIDEVISGKVKGTSQVLAQVSDEIKRLETGSQSVGLGNAERTEMESSKADFQRIYDKLTNGVTSVNLNEKLGQAKAQLNGMGRTYHSNSMDRMDMLSQGATSAQEPVYAKKKDFLKNTYGPRFAEESSRVASVPPVGPYGMTVEKDGQQYRWNSQTGKYNPETQTARK